MSYKPTSRSVLLIHGLKKGNHESFKELFSIFGKPLYRFSYNYLKSKEAAEDVVQEVFTKIWGNRKKLKTTTSFKSYLFTIALNYIRKHFNELSKIQRFNFEVLSELYNQDENFYDNPEFQFYVNKLKEYIELMPEKRKKVFVKQKFERKSIKEIAFHFEISEKTVEYHLSEAMKFLKTEFRMLLVSI